MTRKTMFWNSSRREVIKGGAAAAAAVMLPGGIAEAQTADIPRDQTMILIGINSRDGRWVDYELWNPYAIGANHQNGPNLIYEPLAYYSAFADKMVHVAGRELSSSRRTSSSSRSRRARASNGATARRSAPRTSPTR